MNKFIRCFLWFGLPCLSLCSFAQVPIYITAKVIEKSCVIVKNEIFVDMLVADVKGKQVNDIFSGIPFVIGLKDCPSNGTAAHVKFSTQKGISSYVENDATNSPAKGYAIVIYDKNNHALDMLNNQTDFNITSEEAKGQVDLGFMAYFIKTSADASSGVFNGVASFEISYE